MMGSPEGRAGDEAVRQRQPGGRVNPGDLQGRLGRQVGQQAHQPAGQHGLARPRRPDQQQVVAPGRGHLQRPSRQRLARDVGEVGIGLGRIQPQSRRRFGPRLVAGQRVEQLPERPDRADPVAGHQFGHRAVAGGHDHRGMVHGVDQGERAGHRPHRAVQSQLTQDAGVGDRLGLELLAGNEDPDRDGQVEPGARLGNVAGRQVHGDALHRPFQLAGDDRGPDPVASLPARGVGQADDAEAGQPVGYVDLHRDGMAPDPGEGGGSDGSEHGRPPAAGIGGRRLAGRRLAVRRPKATEVNYSTSRVYLTTARICAVSSTSSKAGMARTPSATTRPCSSMSG